MSIIPQDASEDGIRNAVCRGIICIDNQMHYMHCAAPWGTSSDPFVLYWNNIIRDIVKKFEMDKEHDEETTELIPIDLVRDEGEKFFQSIETYLNEHEPEPFVTDDGVEHKCIGYETVKYVYNEQIKRILAGVTLDTIIKELQAEKEIVVTVEEPDEETT